MILRSFFEERNGRPYTDQEWREAKDALIGFFTILIEWDAEDRSAQRKHDGE